MKTPSEILRFTIKNLQTILSIGYIYILVLGIIREQIFYSFLDINIMQYSNVLDILISPVIIFTEDIFSFFSFILVPFVFYFLEIWFVKFHFKHKEKGWYKRLINVQKLDLTYSKEYNPIPKIVFMAVSYSFLMFSLRSVSEGYKLKKEIECNEYALTHKIVFTDKEESSVKVVSQNSQYLFYISKGMTNVAVSPIGGNIKRIERL